MINFLMAMVIPLLIITLGIMLLCLYSQNEGVSFDIDDSSTRDKLFVVLVIIAVIGFSSSALYYSGYTHGKAELQKYKSDIVALKQKTEECAPLSYNKTLNICVDGRYIKEVK